MAIFGCTFLIELSVRVLSVIPLQSAYPPFGPSLYDKMAPKRKRNTSLPPKGLAPGEHLKRNAITSLWGWVGTEVTNLADITLEHRMLACNLSQRSNVPYCRNKFAIEDVSHANSQKERQFPLQGVNGELDDDIIVISDDDESSCSKKCCKTNPNCLNYLGQAKWEDEGA